MEILINNVDWLAVVVGAVLSFMLGWLWYSPKLFGEKWAEGVGVPFQEKGTPMTYGMLAQAGSTLLLAWAIGVAEALDALPLAVLIGLACAGFIKAGGFFSKKSMYAIKTETGFIIAMVAIMMLVQSVL